MARREPRRAPGRHRHRCVGRDRNPLPVGRHHPRRHRRQRRRDHPADHRGWRLQLHQPAARPVRREVHDAASELGGDHLHRCARCGEQLERSHRDVEHPHLRPDRQHSRPRSRQRRPVDREVARHGRPVLRRPDGRLQPRADEQRYDRRPDRLDGHRPPACRSHPRVDVRRRLHLRRQRLHLELVAGSGRHGRHDHRHGDDQRQLRRQPPQHHVRQPRPGRNT